MTTALDCEALFFVDNANPVRRSDNPCAHAEGATLEDSLETAANPVRILRGNSQEDRVISLKERPKSFKITRHFSNDGEDSFPSSLPVRSPPPLLRQVLKLFWFWWCHFVSVSAII